MSNTPIRTDLTANRAADGVLVVGLRGDWLTQSRMPGLGPVEKELAGGGIKTLSFDAAGLGRWDSALVAVLFKCLSLCESKGIEIRAGTMPEGLAKLIGLARAVPEKKDAARTKLRVPFLQQVGVSGLATWEGGAGMLRFIGENVLALLKMLRGKAQFRWVDTFMVMQECGPRALGIVALINFLVGIILSYVGANQLALFGASIYTADLVAIGTVREMGCIMTGIILCGRTGAAFAAQLGTMKVSQEIEAFQTFGISAVEFLVLPRMLALVLMMPLLCIFADLIAIAGGFLISTLMLDVSATIYLHRTIAAISLGSFLLGIFKGAFFGIIIALTGCLRGMQCGSNAAAVGQATTSAVVTGITTIIACDGIFAVICGTPKL